MTAKTRATRAGFTLIEVLMVIAIIAVLAALLFAALNRARGAGAKVQARSDIQQMETQILTFKKEFGFYPPSHVVCTRTNGTTFAARFAIPSHGPGVLTGDVGLQNDASFAILQRMFPRWVPNYSGSGQIAGHQQNTSAGPLPGGNATAPTPLDPNTAFVYFMNGPILASPGWDVAVPYGPTGATKKGPFYEFPPARLVNAQFLDPWGTPYAYFSSNGDNYDPRASFPWQSDPQPAAYDPSTDTVGVAHPYLSGGKWLNPGKAQIISAGPNKQFGPGVAYSTNTTTGAIVPVQAWDAKNPQAGTSAVYYGETTRGEDDLANFNEGGALGTSASVN